MKVLDTSAVIAFFLDEPGAEIVRRACDAGMMSVVNVCEVLLRLARIGVDPTASLEKLETLGLRFEPVALKHASIAAGFPQNVGLSLGDRMCIALACDQSLPLVTADRVWAQLNLPVQVELIR